MTSHISEEELALHASYPDAIEMTRRVEIERHVQSCAECQEHHDFFAIREGELLSDLREPDSWEPTVPTPTYVALMELGARIAEEDRDAARLLKPFLDNPIATAWATLASKRQMRTGGVVRTLCMAAHAACKSKPLVALTFADAAISVAETLPDDTYPARAVYRLRGTAWKERANALMLLGELPQAHHALDGAERAYAATPHNGLGLAIVALVRAGVFYEQGMLGEASIAAARAEDGFTHAGDDIRRTDAAFLRASILFESGSSKLAARVFRQIVERGENTQNTDLVARGRYALGNCELESGNLAEAALQFNRAYAVFRARGAERERLHVEWGLARVVLLSGKPAEAVSRLRVVAAKFESNQMVTNAALVGVDMADALLVLDRPQEIVEIATHLFEVFRTAGMLTGALSALAYLKEAAASRRLSAPDLDALRTFLRRAEHQPTLLFARPADASR
jgi:tetratricopeptide (TPR) repeat protein